MSLRNSLSKFPDRLRDLGIQLSKEYSLPRWLVLIIDLSVVFFAFFLAYLLRFNFVMGSVSLTKAANQALLTLGVYALFMILFQSYSGLIRHTTIKDIYRIFLATTSSTLALIFLSLAGRQFYWTQVFIIPISILIIHYVVITVMLSFIRIIIKAIFESFKVSQNGKKNTLIFGAGILGVAVKRIIESDQFSGFRITDFIDDNRKLRGKTVNQHPILSSGILDRKFVKDKNIKTIILAINNFPKERKAFIIKKAISLDLEVLEVPSADSWLQGKFSVRQLQRVKPEDLLGRDPIVMDTNRIGNWLCGKTILVTGAAGSIGSELVRQLARFNTIRLVLVDQAETPSFFLKSELEKEFKGLLFTSVIADVTNYLMMKNVFREFRPEVVFHAAAYKHVTMMEDNPREAIRVNTGGTKTVADLAIRYGVEKFIMISSDKVVNPANIMGASKKLCELYVHSLYCRKQTDLQFVTTRFGNVLGSNGSVIPIFKRQIENGGPVTVTHSEITRFFMTIPEACQLVLEAAFMGKGGEIFIFDMGSPVKIYDLAKQMISLSGFIPGEEIKIEVTGLRPGEKLYEELLSDKETTQETYHPKIMIAHNGVGYGSEVELRIERLLEELYLLPTEEVIRKLKELVPEYKAGKREEVSVERGA